MAIYDLSQAEVKLLCDCMAVTGRVLLGEEGDITPLGKQLLRVTVNLGLLGPGLAEKLDPVGWGLSTTKVEDASN